MSKLQEIRKAVDVFDKATQELIAAIKADDYKGIEAAKSTQRAATLNVDFNEALRLLLPIAEAAAALRVDISFVDENGRCISCGRLYTQKHHESCTVLSLFNAFKRLGE